jgi:hypothetical protein
METDKDQKVLEFWQERIAILCECMKGYDAQHYATVLTLRWIRKRGFDEPRDTRWRLLSRDLTGNEPTEPGAKDPDIKPDRGWW